MTRSKRLSKASKVVAAIREQAGLTRRELADHLGVTPSAPAAWENGRCLPGRDNTIKLSRLCGVDPETICALEHEVEKIVEEKRILRWLRKRRAA